MKRKWKLAKITQKLNNIERLVFFFITYNLIVLLTQILNLNFKSKGWKNVPLWGLFPLCKFERDLVLSETNILFWLGCLGDSYTPGSDGIPPTLKGKKRASALSHPLSSLFNLSYKSEFGCSQLFPVFSNYSVFGILQTEFTSFFFGFFLICEKSLKSVKKFCRTFILTIDFHRTNFCSSKLLMYMASLYNRNSRVCDFSFDKNSFKSGLNIQKHT